MNVAQLLQKKREGQVLDEAEIHYLVDGYTKGTIPEYQMAAFLAFIYCKGMNAKETEVLTREIIHSGKSLKWNPANFYVDKHSTGGIGDKISLVLAPLIAACGLKVPMISGRGLGHTGGTLDKLEAISGFSTDVSVEDFYRIVDQVGCAIIGQSADICPADKKIYALRDVTATVPSLPLIVSSIMSKKLAEGVNGLVLDVKFGSGAFMKSVSDATNLAQAMVDVGNLSGTKCVALLTNMNQPLGQAVGNALEVEECIAILKGEITSGEVLELTYALGEEMVLMAKAAPDAAAARALLEKKLKSGEALARFNAMVEAQGGNVSAPLPRAKFQTKVLAKSAGFITAIDTEGVGWAAIALGAGRRVAGEKIDHAVGFTQVAKLNTAVEVGSVLAIAHHNTENIEAVVADLTKAFQISAAPIKLDPLVLKRVV